MADPGSAAGGTGPVDQAQLDAALDRLGQLPSNIKNLYVKNEAFRAALRSGLDAIRTRVDAITEVIPNIKGAQQQLEELQKQIINGTPTAVVVQQLNDVIGNLSHDHLNEDLKALQQAVVALETAVGKPHFPPPPDEFAPAVYEGGYKNTLRSRVARAKRLRTRKRLHSHKHKRSHRRRRRRRKHKKRTHRRHHRRRRH